MKTGTGDVSPVLISCPRFNLPMRKANSRAAPAMSSNPNVYGSLADSNPFSLCSIFLRRVSFAADFTHRCRDPSAFSNVLSKRI